MSIAGPFTHLDYAATPTDRDDGAGGTYPVYPPLAGVFCITDLATFAANAATLTPFRVFPVPAQSVLAGDVPENPVATVTLHFTDAAEAAGVVDPINALPPIPAPPPPPPPAPPPPVRSVQGYRFKAALRQFPSASGVAGRTVRDDVDGFLDTAAGDVIDRWGAPEFYRNDVMLNALAGQLAGSYDAGQALLEAVFDAADLVA